MRSEEEVRAKLEIARRNDKSEDYPWDYAYAIAGEHRDTLEWVLGGEDKTTTRPK